jgi:hypothetical protein
MADDQLIDLLDDELYHSDSSHVSASGLKILRQSPAHFWAKYRDPSRERQKETDALRVGKAVHCASLEPAKFEQRYVRMDDAIDLRTKAAREYRDGLIAAGLSPLKAEEFDKVVRMASIIRQHPYWSAWLTGGEPEYLITWEDSETGVKCKMRADYLLTPEQGAQIGLASGLISDLKSTVDARLHSFQRDAWKMGYHIQAAFYRRGYQAHFGTLPPFVFFAAEKEFPCASIPYPASDDFLRMGDDEVSRQLRIYAECNATDTWPAYPQEAVWLEPPAWALRDEEYK